MHAPRADGAVEAAFGRLRELLERRIGVVLADRAYLVRDRLGPVLAAFGLRDLGSLVLALERQSSGALSDAVVDAMTTHETSWFRDRYPFEVLRQHLLPACWQAGRRLRVWSAACATGQEAYSLAIALAEHRRGQPALAAADYEILGTDVSPGALRTAERGCYDARTGVRGLSPAQLERHFLRQREGWVLRPELRRAVRFQRFNLLEDPAAFGVFDLVFLRNLLIYFAPDTQRALLERLVACLAPGAWLVLGTAETAASSPALLPRRLGNGVVYQRGD
ncbi:MAG TPA: protein-glutamate O-methyltransferase CheR [Gammaproteobacteria bacterium]|nr:protein-glutamate O-methyltransferase CheR [Gammaproteobacteria bacterium]